MAIYLGIDGGGTKTTCVVGDESRVLARATSGGSNVVRSGEEQARENLQRVIVDACTEAGVNRSAVVRVCAGASGAGRPEITDFVRASIAEVVSGEVVVVADTETTLYAAFEDGAGVIVIAGTGSIAYGRNEAGEKYRAGGWGHAVSDEGSGQWIGRTAVSEALRARDEEGESELLTAIWQNWEVADIDAFVRRANAIPPPNFADLLLTVLKAGEAGDEIALGVLSGAGQELARLAILVMERLFSRDERVPVAMSGGVFQRSGGVRREFVDRLRKQWPTVVVQGEVVEAVNGALAMARKEI